MNKKVIIIVLDSVGVGELADAELYGDSGSNTLANCAREAGGLKLPHLEQMGLGCLTNIQGIPPAATPQSCYGKMSERSPGKDTTTGHWEIAGLILAKPFPLFPDGFPEAVIEPFKKQIGRDILGNKVASGTEIIEELGKKHMETGFPIVYTSADSVFQIAAHEEVIPLEELYHICHIARETVLTGPYAVGRVIARPFIGSPGTFKRTTNRHDYSVIPFQPTVLDCISEKGLVVAGVGKIYDIFAGQGVTRSIPITNNMEGVDATLSLMKEDFSGLIFTNLVDFDQLYGHRNDVQGYANCLAEFDLRLPEIIAALGEDDLLIICADHGCDPTTASTDHSREYIPLLVTGKKVQSGINLGVRNGFCDIAASAAAWLGVDFKEGCEFISAIKETQP